MPARLTQNNGITEMAYTGEVPWHRQGQYVPTAMTWEEAIYQAKMDWLVVKEPLYLAHGEETPWFATVRADNNFALGVVGKQYTPVQNVEAFKFLDGIVEEQLAMYETVGSLDGGRKIWLLAKLPDAMHLNNDTLDKYILLSNSHDGSSRLEVKWVVTRVVCANTLDIALKENGKSFKTRHTIGVMGRIDQARQMLGVANQYFTVFEEQAKILQEIELSYERAAVITATVFKLDDEAMKVLIGGDSTVLKGFGKAAQNVMDLYQIGAGNHGQTAWDLFNGFTEHIDHHQLVKGNNPEASRFERSWFGEGEMLRQKAWDGILQAVGN